MLLHLFEGTSEHAGKAYKLVRRELEAGAAAEAAARERLRGLLGRDGDFETLNAALCDGLRAGEIALDHPGLMDHLKRSAAEQVGIDQPGYSGLKALLGEPGGGESMRCTGAIPTSIDFSIGGAGLGKSGRFSKLATRAWASASRSA